MDAKSIYQTLTNLDSFKSLIGTLITMAIGAAITYRLLTFTLKKEIKLFKNLRREIKIFDPPNKYLKDMKNEFEEIEKNPLFKVKYRNSSVNRMAINNIDDGCLVILGYCDDFTFFQEVFNKSADYKIPIIIYTYGDSRVLEQKHWDLLNNYQWYSVCTTPIRLISDIFTILSTFIFKK